MKDLHISMDSRRCLTLLVLSINLFASVAIAEDPYQIAWSYQLGTSAKDECRSVVTDASGNVYISGYTKGSLGGTNMGSWDAYLAKYDSAGNLLWTEQLGTTVDDTSSSMDLDTYGNVYITGSTLGSISETHAGGWDAYIAKYDPTGNLLWNNQLGTTVDDSSKGRKEKGTS